MYIKFGRDIDTITCIDSGLCNGVQTILGEERRDDYCLGDL